MRLLLPVLLFTISCQSAQQQDHSSIVNEKSKTVRVVLLDAQRKPIAGADVELLDSQCEPPNCPAVVGWTQKSRSDGSITIPRNLIRATTLVGTRTDEPRELPAAKWEPDRGVWTLALIGRVATICSRYDSSESVLVADDWRSARIDPSDDLGVMHCEEGKGVFRTCAGPQIPDAGFSASFTRQGDNISVRLTGETIAGPREFAQLDCFHFARAQAPPHDLKTWTVEYSAVGGFARFDRHLRLTQSGDLDLSFQPGEYGSHVSAHAPLELVKRIADFLQVARIERPSSGKPIAPDALYLSLALITNGTRYMLEIPDDLASLLEHTIDSTLKKAFVGTWWESEWKLCKPSAQLTADQIDPPIERLVFQDDGRFSVTWRGGGAEAPGRSGEPFVWISDYSGRYALQPDYNSIHMTLENGIRPVRDFSGDGNVRIKGDKLILSNIWLGTYKAKQKPDICEMTFERTSEPTRGHANPHK